MRCTERIRDLYVTIHIFMNLERAILRLNRSVREIKRLRYDALKRSRKKKGGRSRGKQIVEYFRSIARSISTIT